MSVEFVESMEEALQEIRGMLIEKNRAYGDSALNPCRIFSKANGQEQLLVRIDDKLSRIRNRGTSDDETMDDTIRDLIGYLVLLKIAMGACRYGLGGAGEENG